MAENVKYSRKDFTGQDLSGLPASEFNNSTIVKSNFSQEFLADDIIPDSGGKSIFPADVVGLVFQGCNLDNVALPAGASILDDDITSTNKTIKVENDLNDWVQNRALDTWSPKEPVLKKVYERLGISIDPADLPAEKLAENIIKTTEDLQG